MKLRPMSEAPRDGTAILVWRTRDTKEVPSIVSYYQYRAGAIWITHSCCSYPEYEDGELSGWLPIPYPDEVKT